MVEGTCAVCEKKIIVEKDEDIIGSAYGSICGIKCFDKLCDEVLWVNRKEFKA